MADSTQLETLLAEAMCDDASARIVAGQEDAPPYAESEPNVVEYWPHLARACLSALDAAGYAVVRGWQPIETAPYDTRVEVKVASMTVLATLHKGVSMDEDGNDCDQWAAVFEGEHPPCWTDGACWGSNANEVQSLQPTAWRMPAAPHIQSKGE